MSEFDEISKLSDNSNQSQPDNWFVKLWERILQFGLGESALRFGAASLSISLFVVVALLMGRFYATESGGLASSRAEDAVINQEPTLEPVAPTFLVDELTSGSGGLYKEVTLHTILPSHNRTELTTYTVQAGDSLFSIAEKFGIKPETVLWGNRYTLGEDPHIIYPGQTLNILPVDGVLHMWTAGEGLNGVSEFYKVSAEDIVNFPLNGLSMATIGDFADPNIEPGTLLIIPGGQGVFTDWRTPRISRENPATAKYVGPGACTGNYDGVMGSLSFLWPSTERYLSGFDYSPSTNHYAIDIAGKMGNPIFAADNGVIVYAGWNDYGYGEMVVIDHGYGWQSLYAHLSVINVGCGQEVFRGDTIGLMGSTGNSSGPHLHFELRNDEYGRVNPWDFLQ